MKIKHFILFIALALTGELAAQNLTGKVVALAAREDIEMSIEEHLIVELYSK